MVLALDYMETTDTGSPELRRRFREKIAVGYQRLMGFEVPSEPGGFDWWGRPPANLFLSAYALVSFRDLAEVTDVDPALLRRIVAFLDRSQQPDGSWSPEGVRGTWSTDMAKGRSFFLTATIAWGLARAGAPDREAVAWLCAHADEVNDPYGAALAVLALQAGEEGHGVASRLADRLADLVARDAEGPHWIPEGRTGVGGRGQSAAIETTALAVQALLADGRHVALAHHALERLAKWRDASGRFGTTQSTILALKAFLAAEAGAAPWERAEVRVAGGDAVLATPTLLSKSTEPAHVDLGAAQPTEISLDADARVRAVLSRTTWRPWAEPVGPAGPLTLDVAWPEARLAVGRPAEAVVRVANDGKEPASVVTLEIGLPPGVTARARDVRGEGIANVERDERTMVIYLRTLAPGEERLFHLPFTPRYALDVVTAPSTAYEYYVPEEAVVVAPRAVRAGATPETGR